jgi:hypothetical protein
MSFEPRETFDEAEVRVELLHGHGRRGGFSAM